MAAAFGWGALAASSLVIGAVVALRFRIGLRAIGLIMGFGAGALISAVAFDLVSEAVDTGARTGPILVGIFAGCGVFFAGDWLIDRHGGANRKSPRGAQENDSPLAIVLGTVLDGIPESAVIGLTIFRGGAVGAAYLVAVGMVMLVMPTIDETPGPSREDAGTIVLPGFPAADLYEFRLYGLLTQVIIWATIGLVFGELASRLLDGRKRESVAA